MDRVYTFGNQTRGQEYNRGVDPGSPISVLLFKLFMNTDVALTSLSRDLLWAAGYSDDRAPIFEEDQYENGNAQKAWDSSWKWSEEMKVEYHVRSDDPKRHIYLAYMKKGMKKSSKFDQLKLGETKFEFRKEVRELGLNICTDRDVDGAPKFIYQWGKCLDQK